MNHSIMQLNDLPDEILMIILKKMWNVRVLYSLIGLNKRLDRFACDPIFTRCLSLMNGSSNNSVTPLPDVVLNRFCSEILPKIHHQIQQLNLEALTMERILSTINYPNLRQLGLYKLDGKTVISLLTNQSALAHIDINQIISLFIDVNQYENMPTCIDVNLFLFTQILTMFCNLKYFYFGRSFNWLQRLSFDDSHSSIFSSTLLELHVSLTTFADCLYLLDGRFSQLHTLRVHISQNISTDATISNKDKLPNLKRFSLHHGSDRNLYSKVIVPLIQRMMNLEELHLYLLIDDKQTLVDGTNLKKNIINYMSQLKKFSFSIRSCIYFHNQINFPSNNDIQNTFKNFFKDNQIISCIDYFTDEMECHIYTYPYRNEKYERITNNFPRKSFEYVREISLFDEHPFEHEFFLQIAQSFPNVKILTLNNEEPQKNKQYSQSKNTHQDPLITKYLHLTELNLFDAHDDYIEEFLTDWKTCLPNTVDLVVEYKALKRVTENFTRNTTQINCSKLISLSLFTGDTISEYLKDYFPRAKIFS